MILGYVGIIRLTGVGTIIAHKHKIYSYENQIIYRCRYGDRSV